MATQTNSFRPMLLRTTRRTHKMTTIPSADFEAAVSTYALYSAIIGDWILEAGVEDKISPGDVLLWWLRAPEAEA